MAIERSFQAEIDFYRDERDRTDDLIHISFIPVDFPWLEFLMQLLSPAWTIGRLDLIDSRSVTCFKKG